MSYQIVIKKVTKEFVKDREYVGNDNPKANAGAYYEHEEEKDVERQVYSQIVDDVDLVSVINAVNTPPAKTAANITKSPQGVMNDA